MTVSILGCGWYGFELGKSLVGRWIKVKGSTTTVSKLPLLAQYGLAPYHIDLSPRNPVIDTDFFVCDVLWICIPPKIRAGNGAEYLLKLKNLLPHIQNSQIKQVVLVSSTGVYGDLNKAVTESDYPQPDTETGAILLAAEELLLNHSSFTTTILRFGGLIGPGRDPGRFFAGKKDIPNGQAPVNLIHLTDCIGISTKILSQQAFGYIYNAVCPSHASRSDFYTEAAKRSGLDEPCFVDEKLNWKLVNSENVKNILDYEYKVLI